LRVRLEPTLVKNILFRLLSEHLSKAKSDQIDTTDCYDFFPLKTLDKFAAFVQQIGLWPVKYSTRLKMLTSTNTLAYFLTRGTMTKRKGIVPFDHSYDSLPSWMTF